ncbi:MAG: hypothetical protein NW226_14565 [Microscillaceae bacterium]|nr:hypothetical protein [Microscillaceae bacterium]
MRSTKSFFISRHGLCLHQRYLLIFDFRKTKEYKEELIRFEDKEIFAVWV